MGMYFERELYNCINYLKVLIFLEWDIFCFTSKKRKEVSFSLIIQKHKREVKKKKKKRIRESKRERRNGFVRVREKEERKNGRQEER